MLFALKRGKRGLIMCLLHEAISICSSVILNNNAVKNLRSMFFQNAYPKHFFDLVKIFEAVNKFNLSNKAKENNFSYTCRLGAPYFGRASHNFGCNIAKVNQNKFNVDISVFYRT